VHSLATTMDKNNKGKKTHTLGIRLSEGEINKFTAFAEESGVPVAEMFRRLMEAARVCFDENVGWPRDIVVVKKSLRQVELESDAKTPAKSPAFVLTNALKVIETYIDKSLQKRTNYVQLLRRHPQYAAALIAAPEWCREALITINDLALELVKSETRAK